MASSRVRAAPAERFTSGRPRSTARLRPQFHGAGFPQVSAAVFLKLRSSGCFVKHKRCVKHTLNFYCRLNFHCQPVRGVCGKLPRAEPAAPGAQDLGFAFVHLKRSGNRTVWWPGRAGWSWRTSSRTSSGVLRRDGHSGFTVASTPVRSPRPTPSFPGAGA